VGGSPATGSSVLQLLAAAQRALGEVSQHLADLHEHATYLRDGVRELSQAADRMWADADALVDQAGRQADRGRDEPAGPGSHGR
jgi:hypothetical protein